MCCLVTYFHEHIENLFLNMLCRSRAVLKPDSVTVITALPDLECSFVRRPGAKHSSQYKAVDKLKITRTFVEVKNVVSSQDNKSNVHVSDNLRHQGWVVKMNSHHWSVLQ